MNPKDQFIPEAQPEHQQPTHSDLHPETPQPQAELPRGRVLTPEEERQKQDGFALEEMMRSAGWAIVQDILADMPKANVDPRGMTEEEWKFAQLNAFWQGQVASELLEGLYQLVRSAHTLQQIELGEIQETQRMRI